MRAGGGFLFEKAPGLHRAGAKLIFGPVLMQPGVMRSFINYIGIAILIIGMATGEFIYWRSLNRDSAADDGDSPYDSRVYEQTIERTVGVFGLIMDEFSRGMAALKQPRPLAITIAVISMATAGGCFFVASRLPRE